MGQSPLKAVLSNASDQILRQDSSESVAVANKKMNYMKLTAGESNVKISVIDSKHTLYKVAKAGSIGIIATKGS